VQVLELRVQGAGFNVFIVARVADEQMLSSLVRVDLYAADALYMGTSLIRNSPPP